MLEPSYAQFEKALWTNYVLEPELPEVTELEVVALQVFDDPGRCVRNEDLSPMRCGADSRCSMDP